MKNIFWLPALSLVLCFQACKGSSSSADNNRTENLNTNNPVVAVGAEQLSVLVPKLTDKRVGLVVNNTSMVGRKHLADTLKELGVQLKKIFAPEHGFRGTADPGEHISDSIDSKLGIPIVSIYGKNRKPTASQISDIDIIIFDIQDVGTRFFTYISTMHYVMEACAENNKKMIVLDRPNPNGNYVDGPILQKEFKSFVGMHPIPIVHGLTVGELAQMINGEGWLEGARKCDLEIIPVKNWKHKDYYSPPIKPSPNLPDDQSIKLYPSTCLFEGTVLSVGRGTQVPFQIIGHPDLKGMPYQFTPMSIDGMMKNPPFENQMCYGLDLRKAKVEPKISLQYVIDMYKAFPEKEKFFKDYFNTLCGTATVKELIIKGMTEDEIRATWKAGLDNYLTMRKKYLLYQ